MTALSTERLLDARLVSIPQQRLDDGLRTLLKAVIVQRQADEANPGTSPELPVSVLTTQLGQALAGGHEATAASLAGLLRAQVGTRGVHQAVSDVLAAACTDDLLHSRLMAGTARSLLTRLGHGVDLDVDEPVVVITTPVGDPHDLATIALGQQLDEAGHPSLVAEGLPLDLLVELVGGHDVRAVVLSAHLSLSDGVLRRYCSALRAAAPDLLVVVGGPGAARLRRGSYLVTSDPAVLVDALTSQANVLTQRECEVLHDVAEGLTNAEIAAHLGLSPATVKTHLDHVYAKTGTEHRAAAVARALRQGWIG